MLNSKIIFNLIFIFSIFSISFALYLEFFLGYMPCKLCTYQRIPYYLLIIIGFINIFSKKYFKYLYLVLITLILSELILSGYHSLVTFEIIKYSGCESATLPSDITQLKEALLRTT
jgi:disulfide bond formation protein DsbB